MVIKNNTGHGTPLAFGLSNKENNWTIRLAITAVKNNILCIDSACKHLWHYEDLPNKKGFQRICDCNPNQP
ncbi:gephyrin: PROVISIONAL [Gigaspora margarita]|uniref:Gephyrin: PROVISIONAL n=1 Tax=Gigaspora margarita TaxID=4874 RepID=A0A8H4B5C5_GIGMA|nr:gephyrin: PROVISIONAL [Gigaspora margarita]